MAGSGIGIMEHSHRGKVFDKIIEEAEQACRDLAGIPDDYQVLFLQGGASLQFAMVPMNLLPADRTADYLVTGVWAQKAVKEAKLVGQVHVAVSGEATNFDRIPPVAEIKYSANPAYVHLTTNNTIYGTQWRSEPPVPAGVPLVADTSSDMFSRPIDVGKYGLIYAGAQKNLGPSGVVLVIIRNDLVEVGRKDLPTMLQYRTHAKENSLYNTPNTFGDLRDGRGVQVDQGGGRARGHGGTQRGQGQAALRLPRPEHDLPGTGAAGQPVADERLLPRGDRGAGDQVRGGSDQGGLRRAQGPPLGWRDAGQHLQRLPAAGVKALVEFMKEFERANG